jgi:hypothetical protein
MALTCTLRGAFGGAWIVNVNEFSATANRSRLLNARYALPEDGSATGVAAV